MIVFPFKRIFGLIGVPRCGKNEVANFLTETRGFIQLAFADQIKEEFGISKEDFEAAKIAGNIQELRDELWTFSAEKKKDDPMYFINKVINKAESSTKSVIITDIRTEPEFYAIMNSFTDKYIRRVYWVKRKGNIEVENGRLRDSKLDVHYIDKFRHGVKHIANDTNGLYSFFRHLDDFFLKEDICDIYLSDHLFNKISSSKMYNEMIEQYFYFMGKEG